MKKKLFVLFLLVCTIVIFAGNKTVGNVTNFKVTPETVGGLTSVSFTVNSQTDVSIEVLDRSGTLVAIIASGVFTDGDYYIDWRREDLSGNFLRDGHYIVQVKEDKCYVTTRKTLILK